MVNSRQYRGCEREWGQPCSSLTSALWTLWTQLCFCTRFNSTSRFCPGTCDYAYRHSRCRSVIPQWRRGAAQSPDPECPCAETGNRGRDRRARAQPSVHYWAHLVYDALSSRDAIPDEQLPADTLIYMEGYLWPLTSPEWPGTIHRWHLSLHPS